MTMPAENQKPIRSFRNIPGQPTLENMNAGLVAEWPSNQMMSANAIDRWSIIRNVISQGFLPAAASVELLDPTLADAAPHTSESDDRRLWIIACCQRSLMIRMQQLRTALSTQRKIKRHILGKTDETSSTEQE